jgi:hypothetical protein
MAFEFRDEMITQYWTQGYVIFRDILPPALIKDLRREAAKGREIVRKLHGPRIQRIQPVVKFEELDQQPFKDYNELPALKEAVGKLLTPRHTHSTLSVIGILLEPQDAPWNLGWHRDGPVEVPVEAQDEKLYEDLSRDFLDPRIWNQVNCALYGDSCTWYVPGSHLRVRNLAGERQTKSIDKTASHLGGYLPEPIAAVLKARGPEISNEELERLCNELCSGFPGAVQTNLNAGDFMIYRNVAWHNGNYRHYQPRATLHDIVDHPESGEPWARWGQAKKDALERMKARQAAKEPVAVG